jgi:hypothetical protein
MLHDQCIHIYWKQVGIIWYLSKFLPVSNRSLHSEHPKHYEIYVIFLPVSIHGYLGDFEGNFGTTLKYPQINFWTRS